MQDRIIYSSFLISCFLMISSCVYNHRRNYFKTTYLDYKKPKNWDWVATDSSYTATFNHPDEHPSPIICTIGNTSSISVFFKNRYFSNNREMISNFEQKIEFWEIVKKREGFHKGVKSYRYHLQITDEQVQFDKYALIFYKHGYYIEVQWRTYSKKTRRTVKYFLRQLNVKKADTKDFF